MGFFSWHDSDGDVITNRYSRDGAAPIEMVTPDAVFREENYEGYGIFAGVDYYEMVDIMNGGEGQRERGIQLELEESKHREVMLPRFRKIGDKRPWSELKDPEHAACQGYFY